MDYGSLSFTIIVYYVFNISIDYPKCRNVLLVLLSDIHATNIILMSIQSIYKSFGNNSSLLYAWGEVMHTRLDLLLCNGRKEDLKAIAKYAYEEIKRIEKIGNCFDMESELSLVNEEAAKHVVTLSDDLFDIVNQCINFHKRSYGYFDVTVASKNHNADFISSIHLDAENRTMFFGEQSLKINLSGFLKGYALDKLRPIVLQNGITDALLNMGNSSVMALGKHPYGEGWKLSQFLPNTSIPEVTLFDECLSTSGNESQERRHIIDPHSGKLVEGEASISVITPGAAEGEALSTALFAAPIKMREKIESAFRISES